MPAKSERLHLSLPRDLMARLRREAAARHVPAAQLIALAVERFLWGLEVEERLDRIERLARVCVLALLEDYPEDERAAARRRLAREAAEQMARQEGRRKRAGVGEGPAAAGHDQEAPGPAQVPDRPAQRPTAPEAP